MQLKKIILLLFLTQPIALQAMINDSVYLNIINLSQRLISTVHPSYGHLDVHPGPDSGLPRLYLGPGQSQIITSSSGDIYTVKVVKSDDHTAGSRVVLCLRESEKFLHRWSIRNKSMAEIPIMAYQQAMKVTIDAKGQATLSRDS